MEEITKNNLEQLKRLRQKTKGIDVTDQTKNITDRSFDGTNGANYRNPLDDTYVNNWKDFMKNHRKYLDQAQGKIKMFDEYIKESVDSVEYFKEFSIEKFPKKIVINHPDKMEYEFLEDVLGSNHFTLRYSLVDHDKDNPYAGSAPDSMKIVVGISYNYDYKTGEKNNKIFVSLQGGTREWWSFSYENGKIREIDPKEVEIRKSDLNKIMKAVKSFSIS